MSNFDVLDNEYTEPFDITRFCRGLEEAWKSVPDVHFAQLLDLVFDGYNLTELTSSEMNEMIDEFVLQNGI